PIYQHTALGWGFVDENRRLIASTDLQYPFLTEDVGRTHAILAPFVSDFVVEFAADITDDLADDPSTTATTLVPISPSNLADDLPDGTPDTISLGEAEDVADAAVLLGRITATERDDYRDQLDGSIKWYTSDPLVNNPIDGPLPPATPITTRYVGSPVTYPTFDINKPLTWSIPVDSAATPLHSNSLTLLTAYPPYAGNYVNGDTAAPSFGVYHPTPVASPPMASNIADRSVFVFGHTADVDYNGGAGAPDTGDGTDGDGFEAGSAKWWPYLLRVRYRLHDGDGSFGSTETVSGQPIAGKWFEQIIAVPLN
ncbi:MAG: hypothetical protein AAGL98_02940, partial [Planctomycetota bacterium]